MAYDVLKKLEKLARPTYIPQVTDEPNKPEGSRYGGVPLLVPGDEWPMCAECDGEMQFLFQFNLAELPAASPGLPREGLIQVFDCNECLSWEGFTKTKMCRLVPAADVARGKLADRDEDYPQKSITGWKQAKDYPHGEEEAFENAGLDDDESDAYFDEKHELEQVDREKLLGWPDFVQGIEYEKCPACKKEMTFLTQITSEGNLPIVFGDMGLAVVFYCPSHPDKITFNWACT